MTPLAMLEITLAVISIAGLVMLILVLGPLGWFYYRARHTAAISVTGIEDVN